MSQLPVSLQAGLTALRQLPVDHPDFYAWYTLILRFLFPILAILMLVRIIRSLVKASPKPEVWAYLSLPNGAAEPLTHWENILGRSPASDVVLNYPVVSRQHAALIRTGEDRWTVHDLGSKSGTLLNGKPVDPAGSSMTLGDVLSLGGVDTVLLPVSDEETAPPEKDLPAARVPLGLPDPAHRVSGAHRPAVPVFHRRGARAPGPRRLFVPVPGDVALLPHPPLPGADRL